MKKICCSLLLFLLGVLQLHSAAIPGVPRDSNFNNTGNYDATRVEAQMLVEVDKNTDAVKCRIGERFIYTFY